MSFDKIKAMREAERFLAQGKIRAAISEYKRVVESDKTDVNTLNMLGDLYVKASESDEAVKCFSLVAEHYSKQGFAQKAIAIYNKISRLNPDSIEVSAKLAHLYQMKGSFAEAKTHYTTVAEQYTKSGKKAEALNVWKQIANLDPNNTDIYLKIADACWQDQQKEEAANAYIEAGNRLFKKNQFESAITAFSRALEIRPDDLPALRGYAKSQAQLGYADEAAKTLESSFARQPHNREIINLLADCYIDAGKLDDAEKTIVKLVEQEPTQYPKLLDIFQAFLRTKKVVSAARMLTMASEHMLVGGRAIELEQKINEILALNPDDLDGIRLLVRFHSWQRDEAGIKSSFERLAEAAKQNNAVEDEIQALTQLVMIAPQNVYFAERLHELNLENGKGYYQNSQFAGNGNGDVPTFESFKVLGDEDSSISENEMGFALHSDKDQESNPENLAETPIEVDSDAVEVDNSAVSDETEEEYKALSAFERHSFQTEIEGIDFYVEQKYWDLADKTLEEIEERYGNQPEIKKLRQVVNAGWNQPETEQISEKLEEAKQEKGEVYEIDAEEVKQSEPSEVSNSDSESETVEEVKSEIIETEEVKSEVAESEQFAEETSDIVEDETAEFEKTETPEQTESVETETPEQENSADSSETIDEEPADEIQAEALETKTEDLVDEEELTESSETQEEPQLAQTNEFDDLKSELSPSETAPVAEVDNNYDDAFETSYQTGIVYREMGLIEDSIREFQDAIKRVTPLDGTRRFFLCCNMLGVCFMEKQMPTIAIMWFKKGLDSNHLSEYEKNGTRYELANAYEKAGDKQKAQSLFEEIYAVDVSFRDVGLRLQQLITA